MSYHVDHIDPSIMAAATIALTDITTERQVFGNVSVHSVKLSFNGQHGGVDMFIEGTNGLQDEPWSHDVVLR